MQGLKKRVACHVHGIQHMVVLVLETCDVEAILQAPCGYLGDVPNTLRTHPSIWKKNEEKSEKQNKTNQQKTTKTTKTAKKT